MHLAINLCSLCGGQRPIKQSIGSTLTQPPPIRVAWKVGKG